MIWTHAAAGAAALLAGFIGGWQVRDWKAGADDADRIALENRDRVRRAENADRAAAGHEAFKTESDARERVITREVERVVQAPAYRAVCIDADGLRILAADAAARTTGQPAPAVPGASSPR